MGRARSQPSSGRDADKYVGVDSAFLCCLSVRDIQARMHASFGRENGGLDGPTRQAPPFHGTETFLASFVSGRFVLGGRKASRARQSRSLKVASQADGLDSSMPQAGHRGCRPACLAQS